jgi:hypothetical protein
MAFSSNTNFIIYLNNLTSYLNRYLLIGILLFGIIGNLPNSLALSQKTLCSNPRAFLFLASSITIIIMLISGVAVRLSAGWSAHLTDTVGWLCKLRVLSYFHLEPLAHG